MEILGQIQGQIITKKIITPSDGKPHLRLQVMQIIGDRAGIVRVKDFNLNAKYNGEFNKTCRISDWNFNGKTGITVSVIGGLRSESGAEPKEGPKV